MKVIREITYEGDDEDVKRTVARSLADGQHRFTLGLTVTVKTLYIEGQDATSQHAEERKESAQKTASSMEGSGE